MIVEEVVVAHIEVGRVWVEKTRNSACGSCGQSCLTASVADYVGKARTRFAVNSPIELRVGDHVVIGIPEDALVKGTLGVYLIPLGGLFAGSMLGKTIGVPLFCISPDLAAAFGGIIGLIATIIFLKYIRVLSGSEFQPVVLRKLS